MDFALKQNSNAPSNPAIWLEMHKASVAEVLNAFASHCNMKVRYESYGVALSPRD